MEIKSYLAFVEKGMTQEFAAAIQGIEGCESVPADNKDVFVVVTEAEDENVEKEIISKISSATGLQCLSLVSAWNAGNIA